MRNEIIRIIATIKAVHGITTIADNKKVVTKLMFHTLLSREKTI
jgi:hypothetical protein